MLLGEKIVNITLAHPVPTPDPPRCGMGQGERCCIFLIFGQAGFECARYTPLEYELRRRVSLMNARRVPADGVEFPDCMEN